MFKANILISVGFFSLSSVVIADNEVKIKPSMRWYTTGSWQAPAESRLNPDNTILAIPDRIGAIDLRPSIKADSGAFQLIARPQLRTAVSAAKIGEKHKTEHPKSTALWLEAYGNWNASDQVLVSYGRQNYQWGAAESVNPSNRIFHETIESKDLLYTIQGRNIARVNITWFKNFSTVLMSETEQVKEVPVYQAEELFQSKSLMKHEFSWNSGADYIGIVYGAAETDGPWLGEYVNTNLFWGLSVYADASHQRQAKAWYPVTETSTQSPKATVVQLRQSKIDNDHVQTLAVGGLRYSFENGSDLRMEYILNTAGWSKDENELAMNSIDSNRPLQLADIKTNALRFYKPGLEYRGQRYGLISLRVPDLFTIKDLTLYLRHLRSLQDASSSNYTSIEYSIGDTSTLILSGLGTTGEPDQELRGFVSRSVLAGVRQDF